MRIDAYTKAVLTIIAVALVWIAAGGPDVFPAVEAQDGATRVVVVGWEDRSGKDYKLPDVSHHTPSLIYGVPVQVQ